MRLNPSIITQKWNEPGNFPLPGEFGSFVNLPDLVLRILHRQGLRTSEEIEAFLDFRLYSPSSPYEFPEMEKGIERTIRAITEKEMIGVWGDFDVDGQTSTALLVSALRKAGARVDYHVPIRGQESHGIQLKALQKFVKSGISLIITCDTGISEVESVAWAKAHGVDVIITDHHTLPESLPTALAIINPQQLDPSHPLRPLPGVGVACVFAEALLDRCGLSDFSRSLHDLAALGIIADIAELRADARYLTQSGIDLIRNTSRPSIAAMLKAAEIDADQFSEESISYSLAPRMNAVGRLADANPMVEFLLSEDSAVLSVTVNQLEGLNAQRKLLCDQVFQGALDQIDRDPKIVDHPVILLNHPEWPAGVVGIVASRLVSIYHRPVILLVAPDGQLMRGSARSVEGINITAAIREQSSLLSSFGGHPMAAGLSLDPLQFKQFQRSLDRTIEAQLADHPLIRELQIDAWQPPASIDLHLLQSIDRLAPFGAGNPPLVFAARDLHLNSSTAVGKTHDHLQMLVEDSQGNTSKFIWWQGAGLPQPEGKFDLAYTARSSTYKGKPQVQLEWLDYRLAEPQRINLADQKNSKIEHWDYRLSKNPEQSCLDLIKQHDPEVYREGSSHHAIQGKTRLDLVKNESLILWTIPPSQPVLDEVIQKVHPKKIYWFGLIPSENEIDILLKTTAQNLKQSFSRQQSSFDLLQLASTLAVNVDTLRLVLYWFAARGDISISHENGTLFEIHPNGNADQTQQKEIQKKLQRSLAETQAFRRFYLKTDLNSLSGRP